MRGTPVAQARPGRDGILQRCSLRTPPLVHTVHLLTVVYAKWVSNVCLSFLFTIKLLLLRECNAMLMTFFQTCTR